MKKGTHHSVETKIKIGKKSIGRVHSKKTRELLSEKSKLSKKFSGKTHSLESRIKIRESMKKNGWFPPAPIIGSHRSDETKEKIRNSNKGMRHEYQEGSKHWNWKGGKTHFLRLIRNCPRYKEWRTLIFKRDGFSCVSCLRKSRAGFAVYLEADHYPKRFIDIIRDNKIKSVRGSINCTELWDIKNGRTLCRECHNITRGKIKK